MKPVEIKSAEVKQEEIKIEEVKEEKEETKNYNDYEANKVQSSSNHRYTIIITLSVILFMIFAIFSTIFALLNKSSNKIVAGVSVKGIDVSGLTYDEAQNKLINFYNEKLKQNISLKHNDYETSLIPEQIEAKFDVKESLDAAYNIGRSGKVLKDNYKIISVKISKIDITPSFTYNEKALDDFIESTSENLPDKVKQSSYSIESNKLIISKGEKGYTINKNELKNTILDNIVNLRTSEIEVPVEIKEPDPIDIEKVHSEIYKEAKDAYYTTNPFAVYPHENGVDFEVSIEEAKKILNSEEQEIVIPLKISKPKVTTSQIGSEAFPDLLATYSTTFATSNTHRASNIRLATSKINGYVLLPGAQFSYNAIIGKRTPAAGFKEAGVYMNGKVETGIGGGICQVSSTLYNSVLRANLEIVKRSNHTFATGYVPLSTDATVSWGGPEFIFKNTRKYPIKIVANVSGGRIKVDIYGHKEDVEYDVIIKSETLQTIPMKTEYRTNPALPVGTTKTVQKGHGGYKSRAYRILKLNGQVVSTQLLSTDTYSQLSTIIEKN